MELPPIVAQFMHKKEEKEEYFLSILVDIDGVVACLWTVDDKRMPRVTSSVAKHVETDEWDARIDAAREAVLSLDVEADIIVDKVILGLPAVYLSENGDILKEVRPYLKKLTRSLELVPLGFVSIHQAVVHELKREEGVPPTVILLGISDGMMTVSVYKIGALVGQKTIHMTAPVVDLEEAFRGFQELEVLPSRILMFGMDSAHLEELKRDLLRHPWQTRANFMHFPKIDTLGSEKLIGAVSLVGASELATALTADEPEEEAMVQEQEAKEEAAEEGRGHVPEEKIPIQEESNMSFVDPGVLGFKKSIDVLSERTLPHVPQRAPTLQQNSHEMPLAIHRRHINAPSFPSITIPPLPLAQLRLPASFRTPIAIGMGILVLGIIGWFLYWEVPHASVTINEVPKKLTKSVDISIDSTAAVADPTSKILPGKKQEQTVNGDKAIVVTGKKQVGDPARGAVTITNRTLDSISLPKGTVLTGGNLEFTLDSDVMIASPTSYTQLSTNTGSITASAIGASSNLPSGTTFSIKGYSLSEVLAQNSQALAGGTSRDVTVVTRADEDALVKSLTLDLVDKAKQALAGNVLGDETLIDSTIKTSVVDKQFVEELDQQAGNLHGKLSLMVDGVSYTKSDLMTLMTGIVAPDVPTGYAFDPKNMTVSLKDITVKKDGKITATANFDGTATPKLDLSSIAKAIAGKSVVAAEEYLKSIPGVGSADVNVKISPWKNILPANVKNISLRIAIE